MAYSLYTQSFGLSKANSTVTITRADDGTFATVLASSSGGFLNDRGQAKLDSSGNLSVYIDTSYNWIVTINDASPSRVTNLHLTQEDNAPPKLYDQNNNFLFSPAPLATAQTDAGSTNVLALSSDNSKLVSPSGASLSYLNGVQVLLPQIMDVRRTSANDSTDTVEVVVATMTVPGSILQQGSIVEVFGVFENSNSAVNKVYNVYVNGNTLCNNTASTAQSMCFRVPLHIKDNGTFINLNNATSSGGGTAGGTILSRSVTDIMTYGLTVTMTVKFGAATASEYIHLHVAKCLVYGQV